MRTGIPILSGLKKDPWESKVAQTGASRVRGALAGLAGLAGPSECFEMHQFCGRMHQNASGAQGHDRRGSRWVEHKHKRN